MKSRRMKKGFVPIICFIAFFMLISMPRQVEAADAEGNLVIVLDPGHGGGDPGAMGGGIREDQVNFKIAQFAKEELEQYEGVKVYLTRYNNNPEIYDRVEIAKNYQADLLVSLHINSGGGGNSKGAAIWVTQDGTQVEYKQKASDLGSQILSQINYLGVKNNGVQIRSGKADEWYDSGVVQDYYGIIRYAQRVKMRSILVEHCFIDSASDREFINSDEKIRKIAHADAQGIVNAYQLIKKGEGKKPITSIKLKQPEANLEITSENPNPTYFIPVTYIPNDATNKTIYWYTSNASVATVSGGMIYAKAQGEATITAITGNNQRLASCKVKVSKPKNPLTGIRLKQENVTVKLGEQGFIGAIYEPENTDDKVLYWTSSNEQIAKINEGTIIPVGRGTATLTAISRAGGKTATCQVTVVDPNFIGLEEIKMKVEKMTLKEGEKGWAGVNYVPNNAQDKVLSWHSSDASVATVEEGVIQAKKKGKAMITAKSRDGDKTATCEVDVTDGNIPLESISLKKTKIEMRKGGIDTLYVDYNPSNVSDKVLYWTSSNENIVTVSGGNIIAIGGGIAKITAKSRDGEKTATCEITVIEDDKVALENLSLKTTKIELKKGAKETIYAVYNPSNVTDKELSWTSSNENVATVVEGNVTAIGKGTAIITAKSRDGGKTATCEIIVIDGNISLESLSLKTTELEIRQEEQAMIYASYNPSTVTDKTLYWTSSNTKIATVSEGRVLAIKPGTATITAKSRDGGKTATCQVTVTDRNIKLQSISLQKTKIEIKQGEMAMCYATYSPANASNKVLAWTSSNQSIATVSEGRVIAVSPGTAAITAKSQDGGKIATCQVTVTGVETIKLQSLSLDTNMQIVTKGKTSVSYAGYKPSNVSDKVLYWTSSNSEVATVSEGIIRAINTGVTTITAKSRDGGKTATCQVIVINPNTNIKEITLPITEKTMKNGESTMLYTRYNPSDVKDKILYWVSSDLRVATVSEGVVKAIGIGEATITVISRDGGKMATCKIQVKD